MVERRSRMTMIKMARTGTRGIFVVFCLTLSACTAPQMPISEASATPAGIAAAAACRGGANALGVAEVDQSLVRPWLAFETPEDFGDLSVRKLSGPCAPAVEDMMIELVRLVDGRVFRITPAGLVPAPEAREAFEAKLLDRRRIPQVPNMRFVDADDYIESEGRYVGVWTDSSTWLVGSFRVSPASTQVRPLFRSTVPLKSVSFFPSIDTPSGQLWLVQEGKPGDVRVITVGWTHERVGLPG
jgi:hypothetical protein